MTPSIAPAATAVTLRISRGYFALVSPQDYDFLATIRWTANVDKDGRCYAVGCINGVRQPMHRFIAGVKPGEKVKVDHIDTETLHNWRENLRVCSNTQNIRNQRPHRDKKTSKYKGVYFSKADGKFHAQIEVDRKKFGLGSFSTEELAASAYDAKCRELFGEFARPNPPSVPSIIIPIPSEAA